MAVEQKKTVSAYLTVQTGTSSSGNPTYAQVSMGPMNPETFDKDKFYAIAAKVGDILDLSVDGYYHNDKYEVGNA